MSTVSAQTRPCYRLPQVEKLLREEQLTIYIEKLSRPLITQLIRQTLSSIRESPTFKRTGVQNIDVLPLIIKRCQQSLKKRQISVINATGIAIHTNLGRSPIHPDIWQDISALNSGYCNLELALQDGKRGQRDGLLPDLIQQWVGAEDALIANNNAAAVYLMLHALTLGKEVIVSRSEQVQIGGGFRIPDILKMSGCTLVEVGTTNITTAQDYLDAITENTAAILMVHQSNFSIEGFSESPDIHKLVKQRPENVMLLVDQGSGFSDESYSDNEQSIRYYLNAGVDLVCFSGDKVLGGPQAGIIAGKTELIRVLSKHPMMRTFRSGRIILSMLESLLINKLNKNYAGLGIAQRLIEQIPATGRWAEQLASTWQPFASVTLLDMQVGGGSLPSERYQSYGIALTLPGKAQTHLDHLRDMPIPIIGYLHKERLLINLVTILEQDKASFEQQMTHYIRQFQS
ncbi:L-seryl-tRNA(Sec) selenium transferase [Vibrio mediterranei]